MTPLADQSWPRRARQLTKIYVRCFRYALAARAREAELVSMRKALADTIRERDACRSALDVALELDNEDAQRIDALEAKVEAVRALANEMEQIGLEYTAAKVRRALGDES